MATRNIDQRDPDEIVDDLRGRHQHDLAGLHPGDIDRRGLDLMRLRGIQFLGPALLCVHREKKIRGG